MHTVQRVRHRLALDLRLQILYILKIWFIMAELCRNNWKIATRLAEAQNIRGSDIQT
jgi:hypothetical protein